MAKLHELLATDGNLKGQALKTRTDLAVTFEKKKHLFEEKIVTYTPDNGGPPETREQKDIQSTVRKEIEWITPILVKSWDAAYAIDIANVSAKSDIILDDGATLAKDVPATALLQLEHRVKEVLDLVKVVPTLDPTKGFRPDEQREKGIYKARENKKDRTEKIEDFIVVVPASKEHPAQVAKVNKDVKIGSILDQEWSSMITPAMKADLIERGEELLRAVTKARSRANGIEIDVKTHKIGKTLLEYVFQPLA